MSISDVAYAMRKVAEERTAFMSESELILHQEVSVAADDVVEGILKRPCTGPEDNDWYALKEFVIESAKNFAREHNQKNTLSSFRHVCGIIGYY